MRAVPLAAALGLVSTGAVGAWWLTVESRAASGMGGSIVADSTLASSASALQALCLCQLFTIVLFGPRLGLVLGSREAASVLVSSMAIGWPLAALLWAATPAGAGPMLVAQIGLVLLACGLAALGAAVRRDSREQTLGALLSLGSTLGAALLWWSRERWLAWLL